MSASVKPSSRPRKARRRSASRMSSDNWRASGKEIVMITTSIGDVKCYDGISEQLGCRGNSSASPASVVAVWSWRKRCRATAATSRPAPLPLAPGVELPRRCEQLQGPLGRLPQPFLLLPVVHRLLRFPPGVFGVLRRTGLILPLTAARRQRFVRRFRRSKGLACLPHIPHPCRRGSTRARDVFFSLSILRTTTAVRQRGGFFFRSA